MEGSCKQLPYLTLLGYLILIDLHTSYLRLHAEPEKKLSQFMRSNLEHSYALYGDIYIMAHQTPKYENEHLIHKHKAKDHKLYQMRMKNLNLSRKQNKTTVG